MKRRAIAKIGICFALTAVLLITMAGLTAADGLLEDNPLGDALDKLNELGEQITDILVPGKNTGTTTDASGSGGLNTGLPAPELGDALDPSAIPGAEDLAGALDPSNAPGLDALTGALDPDNAPGLDALTGILNPSNIPGLDSLPGADKLSGGFPSLPGMEGVPEMPGMPEMDPMQVLQIVDEENQLFLVIDLDGLLEAELGLGKNLEEAPLLDLSVRLFNALAAEGSLGIKKIDDNAFLLPLEFYLKYMAGEEGWKEILDVVVPLELSFPGAGMVPDGAQTIIDALYKYLLKPILSLLPIYKEVGPEPVDPEPSDDKPAVVPGTEVGGEVTASPVGGSGDHLPFTGAELTLLFTIIAGLAVSGLLLKRLERKMRSKAS